MFKHDKDIIFLNGLKIPLKVFKMLEPSYQYPKDLVVMFYDGNRKNYRTKHGSWSIAGNCPQCDRYLTRISEFSRLMSQIEIENLEIIAEVNAVRTLAELDIKAKYPLEDTTNVDLQQFDDLKPSGIEGIRSQGKRSSRGGNKHSRGATGRSSE